MIDIELTKTMMLERIEDLKRMQAHNKTDQYLAGQIAGIREVYDFIAGQEMAKKEEQKK